MSDQVTLSRDSMTESEIRREVENLLGAYPEGNTTGIAFVPSADGPYCIECAVNILVNEIDTWQWDGDRDMFILASGGSWDGQEARPFRDTDPTPDYDIPCFGCGDQLVREGKYAYDPVFGVKGFTADDHPEFEHRTTTLCLACARRIFGCPGDEIAERSNSLWMDSPGGAEDITIHLEDVDCDICRA